MGLRVYYSERIEDVARQLKTRLLDERAGGDAFSFSQIVVPNANMAKWLRIRAFADAPSLCAGVEFPFIELALHRAMNASLPPENRVELLPMNAYANGIMAILLDGRIPSLAPFYRYIADVASPSAPEDINPRRAWQLCVKLADLMDQYEVRRTDIVENWLRGRGIGGGDFADEVEAAEAELARRLFGPGGVYPPDGRRLSLRQLCERAERLRPSGPDGDGGRRATYRFFGLSTLTPLQVRIFRWLAKGADVEVYHNNVCLEYWGDIETRDEARRMREKCRLAESDEDFAIENPLLREWGVAGRETLRLLAGLEEEGDGGPHFEWHDVSRERHAPASLLETVQRGICRRTGVLGRRGQDGSLQVVAAPGLRREVEMVHNAILGLVERGDCGSFSDVAVLVTDMKRYRPMIEAVFGARRAVPYGLIDTSAAGDSDCLAAFSALTALAAKGLSRATLFAALENPCVQRALGFSQADARTWRSMAEDAGAFEGFDCKGDFGNFSWDAALARLRLGFIADDAPDCAVCQCADESALKFSEVVELLHRSLSPLGALRTDCAGWARLLRDALDRFIDVGDDAGEAAVRRSISETLGAMRQTPGEHPLSFVATAVEEFVGGMKSARSGYLTHGVTIASLQPMRPVPFRTIFVLGMGEGCFPGRESASTLDMRGAKRGLGDASSPVQNRYLFLETLMAARDRLVISYQSLDTQKDAKLFPSGTVGELEKFLEDAVLADGEPFHEIPVPLLERGEEGDCPLADPVGEIDWQGYWAGIVQTYSDDARRLAMRIADGQRRKDPCAAAASRPDATDTVSAAALADFIIDPLQGVMRHRFGIPAERDQADAGADDPPLELPAAGSARRRFEAAALAGMESAENDAATALRLAYDSFAAHGSAPLRSGFFGSYAFKREVGSCADGENCFLETARRFAEEMAADGSGTSDCRALVLKSSECDSRTRRHPAHPPVATIRPLVDWLARVAERTDDAACSLRVGIVDFPRSICVVWAWNSVTGPDARKALDGIRRRYLSFAEECASEDGLYPKTSYRLVADALDALKRATLPDDSDENGWRELADAMAEPFADQPSHLPIAATKEALERLPRAADWRMLRDHCRVAVQPVLCGEREER